MEHIWETAEMLMKRTGFRPSAIGHNDEMEHLIRTMEQYTQDMYDTEYAARICERYDLPCVDDEHAEQYLTEAGIMLAAAITKSER